MARRRSSSEVDEDESAEDSYASQSLRGSKRARFDDDDDDDVSETSDGPVLPDSYRSRPRQGANGIDDEAPLKHQPGSIVRVKLINFVTYTSAEFQLGPSLNMIIGPNGTGKSTLVCAICLGLGWGPQHLGRAKDIGEFVKHGAREAEIEIELAGGPQSRNNPVIRRTIRKEGNKSSFFLNGNQTTHKVISRVCKSFSIQIDNLCQFLPQDRVVEFAALNPVQLLEQTQRAAAPDHMVEWHDQLKDMRKEQKSKIENRDRERDLLTNMQNRHNAQRADVERMQERQSLMEKHHAYERLKPFVHYRTAKKTWEDHKIRLTNAKAQLEELENDVGPSLQAVNDKQQYHNQVERAVKQQKGLVERGDRETAANLTKLNNVQAKLDDKEKEKITEVNSNRERKADLNRVNRKIQEIDQQMQQKPPEFDPASFNEKSREKQRNIRDLEIANREVEQSKQDLAHRLNALKMEKDKAQREVESLNSQAGQQANKLKHSSRDTATAWEWIQNNRHEFKGEVYGPPIVSCSVTNPRLANAVESMFQKGDFLAFTCTDNSDFKMLGRKFNEDMGLRDIHLKEAIRPRESWRPMMSTEELRQYGLDGWVIDYLSGPDPVLSVLCDTLKLHQCAVTLQDHNNDQYERLRDSHIQRWVTSKASYNVVRRREYGDKAVSTMVRDIKPAEVWTNQPTDMGAQREHQVRIRELDHHMEELSNQANEMREQIQANRLKIRDLQKEKEDIDNEKAQLQKLRGAFDGLQTRRDTEVLKRTRLDEELASHRACLDDIEAQVDKLALEKGQASLQYSISVNLLLFLHEKMWEAEIIHAEALSELETLQSHNQEVNKLLQQRRNEIEAVKRENRRLKEEAVQLSRVVNRINEERSEEEEALVRDVQAIITLEELEAEIESFQARLSLLHGGDPNALRDYEKRATDIARSEEKLAGIDAELEELQERIDQLKARWEPELDVLVQKISDAFSFNFSKIGCAGQVSIHKAEDFADWAIQIQVKFREQEQLSILDSHRQSGGERAVSTIFYLMALQSLARSPFRVVDEINQGMDPRNERMVHERMVDIACQEHTSQYFLITPKLLHGLKFHRRMMVHCIASGEYMPTDYKELDFKKLVEVAQRARGRA